MAEFKWQAGNATEVFQTPFCNFNPGITVFEKKQDV
jgi:hypothetical protein